VRLGRIRNDGFARGRHAGRIGQRKIALGDHRLGRVDRDLAGGGLAVVLQRSLAQLLIHIGFVDYEMRRLYRSVLWNSPQLANK